MAIKQKRDLRVIIFSAIGVFNTLFDLVLYVVLYNLTKSLIISNIIATSAALVGSYILNSRLTFKSRNWTKTNFLLFVIVTVFGLWILQTGVIYLINPLVKHVSESIWQIFGPFEHTAKIVVPKLIATAVTLVWNFVWYNRVIFKNSSIEDQIVTSLEEL